MSKPTKAEKRWAIPLSRKAAAIESRTDGDQPVLISGYGIVYYDETDAGTEYRVDVDLVERFRPGCFDAFLASNRDCYCAPYHDENRVLGRRSSMMELHSDDRGVRYTVPYDLHDPDHVSVGAKIRRGDITGASANFVALAEEWRRDEERNLIVREIVEAELLHVGPVIGEAYASTSAEIRSDGGWELIQERKARFLASELAGAEELLIEIDAILLE